VSWPVYSYRFGRNFTANTTAIYTVPGGYRAVVRCITAVNYGATDALCYVAGAAGQLFRRTFQANGPSIVTDVRAVLYAGEQLSIYVAIAGMDVSAHGYLFHETAGQSLAVPLPLEVYEGDAQEDGVIV
jgi:hypothetical protein